MNFEVIDNIFQICVLLCVMMAAFVCGIRRKDRRCLILGLAYACFAMGTLYFVLHIVIMGVPPQIFYVAEVSWLASYLFYLLLLMMESGQEMRRVSWKAFVPSLAAAAVVWEDEIFGPSPVMCLLFALTAGAIVYRSVSSLERKEGNWKLHVNLLICVGLQLLLYRVSDFIRDYTRFNLYFAVDFLLTGSFAALLPLTVREVKHS